MRERTVKTRDVAKKNLAKLRSWLKEFKAKAALGEDPSLFHVEYLYFFTAPGDGEEPEEIEELDLFATSHDERGHPMPGVYTVKIVNKETGEIIRESEGTWREAKEVSHDEEDKEKRANDPAGIARGAKIQIENSVYDIQRYRKAAVEAEEKLENNRRKLDEYVDAQLELKQRISQLTQERDEAIVQRKNAEDREQAREIELEAFKSAGGELAPLAEGAVSRFVDRAAEILELHNPALHREAFQFAQEDVASDLLANLPVMIGLVHEGVLKWPSVRMIIFSGLAVDPGPEVVPVEWEPPEIVEQPEETAAE